MSPRRFPAFLAAILAAALAPAARSADWPHLHGPQLDGVSSETGLDPKAIVQVWKASVGTGFASIAVSGGTAYTVGNTADVDIVYALDAATGQVKWRKSYPAELVPNMYEGGPNATPTVHGGKVYTLSKAGLIHCFDAATGSIIWKLDAQQHGATAPDWGFAGPATIVGEAAIFNVGDAGLAVNKDSGKILWKSAGGGAGYAPPVPFPGPGGDTAVAIFRGSGLLAVDPATGNELWHHEWITDHNVNAATPLYFDGKFFLSSSYEKGCCLIDVSGEAPRELWRNNNMHNHFSTSAFHKDRIYGIDGHSGRRANLVCLDPKGGSRQWKRELGFGSLRLADGKLFVLNEDGELFVAEATSTGYLELARKRVLSSKCWTVPTIANGRLLARNAGGDLICLSLKSK